MFSKSAKVKYSVKLKVESPPREIGKAAISWGKSYIVKKLKTLELIT
jgi:hypothetical protein